MFDQNQPEIHDVLSQNRAEELGYDVWRHFVIPPFYNELGLTTARKPKVIIGGRGSGKTMLLRYLSHQSMFSPDRQTIPPEVYSHIGLYWRAETQFCNAMRDRGLDEGKWDATFNHFAALVIGIEILSSLNSITGNPNSGISPADIDKIDFGRLKSFDEELPSEHKPLQTAIEDRLWQLEAWVNDLKRAEPKFFPGMAFLKAIVTIIQSQVRQLKGASFVVYLDEYENLMLRQQSIINSWVKHSESPIIMNLAMKRNAFGNKQTVGNEHLANIHDYRILDIEEQLDADENFQILAAEILLLKLSNAQKIKLPFDSIILTNPASIGNRRSVEHRKVILDVCREILPTLSNSELAKYVFAEHGLRSTLLSKIKTGLELRNAKIEPDGIVSDQFPEASIVVSALIHRKKLPVHEIALEFSNLRLNKPNKFTGATSWIHNNFIGCFLQLFVPYSRPCPFYSGFETFSSLSRSNLRHFFELCHKSLLRAQEAGSPTGAFSVPPLLQAEAARQASSEFLGEIRSFGPRGNQLHTFVIRLGGLFALSHRRPTQSEPEQSHFAILRGTEQLSDDDQNFLNEAIKWSVLYEVPATKRKAENDPQTIEYVLNPIYAPYFFISYRKKHKLEITTQDAITMIRGDIGSFSSLLKRYSARWEVDPQNASPIPLSLFEL